MAGVSPGLDPVREVTAYETNGTDGFNGVDGLHEFVRDREMERTNGAITQGGSLRERGGGGYLVVEVRPSRPVTMPEVGWLHCKGRAVSFNAPAYQYF